MIRRTLVSALMLLAAVAAHGRDSLTAPDGVTTVIDFTTTTLPLTAKASYSSGDAIVTGAGSPTAGCTYELVQTGPQEKRGLLVTMPAGFTNNQYCSPAYRFGTRTTLTNREFLAADIDFGTESVQAGLGNSPNYAQVRALLVQYSSGMTYSTKTADLQQYGSVAKSPWRQHFLWRFGGSTSAWTLGGGGAPDGWPNNAQVDGIEFRFINITATASQPQQFLIKSIKLQPRGRTFIKFSFDDCRATQLTSSGGLESAADILTARGIKATAFCSSNYVGSSAAYLSEADIATLRDTHGWDFQIQQTETTGLPGVTFGNAGASGLTRSSSTCTLAMNSATPHGYTTGDTATIAGAVDPNYNGRFVITEGANNYTYTFTCTAAGAASSVSPASGAVYSTRKDHTETTFKANLRTELDYFRALGFTNLHSIGWSTGMATPEMAKWARDVGFSMGRGGPIAGGAPLASVWNPQGGAERTLMVNPYFSMANQASAAIIAIIDKAIQYGTPVSLVGHDVADCSGASGDTYTTCDADLATVADYVQLKYNQGLLEHGTETQFSQRLH